MSWLAANATSLVAIAVAIGGYIWNRLHVANVDQGNALVSQALAAVGSLFDAYVSSASTAKSLADVGIELRGLAAVQMGKLGIYEGTATRALLDAGINALIAGAIAQLVARHPDPTSLHGEVKSALAPAVRVS